MIGTISEFLSSRSRAARDGGDLAVVEREPTPPAHVAPTLARPLPVVLDLPELPDLSEYEEVAATLGFRPPELDQQAAEIKRREVIGFLLDNGFPIYDNDEVHAFMSKLAAERNEWFCWARLDRTAESEQLSRLEWDREMRMAAFGHRITQKQHGQLVHTPYSRPVPLNILKRAAAIRKKFGEEVGFYVSDYASVDPDPFIAVKRGGGPLIIFGVWDEPGFGGALKRDREGR